MTIEITEVITRMTPKGLVFLCADDRLLAAAEGLAVDNPNNHP